MDPDAIRQFIKEQGNHECTEEFPELMAFAAQKFLEEFLSRFEGIDGSEITPKMIADMIKSVPEYSFLQPVIPKILKSEYP